MKWKNIIIIGVVISLIIIGILVNKKDPVIEGPSNTNVEIVQEELIVEIKGEVMRPALYALNSGARIHNIIELAGGLTPYADTSNINLAQKLTDGMVVYIPSINIVINKISINKASLNELMKLKGIGESKARSIIDFRNNNGPFSSIEGLLNVPGISQNIFDQIKDNICL